ncbi:MAG: hypothetical protein MK132_07320 [Lentisphaerales bacterium]|nr:hypothetical protein [Lentisphaerales bacterium]
MTADNICKKCQTPISGDEFRMVADWKFCLSCFDDMMNKQAVKKEEPQPEPIKASFAAEEFLAAASSKKEEAPSAAEIKCQMCDCKIPADTPKFLGVWQLCQNCEDNMAFKLQPVVIEEEEPKEEDEPDTRRRDLNGRVLQAAPDESVCVACNRPIFVRAAKKIDDQLYCPECFYKIKSEEN